MTTISPFDFTKRSHMLSPSFAYSCAAKPVLCKPFGPKASRDVSRTHQCSADAASRHLLEPVKFTRCGFVMRHKRILPSRVSR